MGRHGRQLTKSDVQEAISYVVREREARRRGSDIGRQDRVREMNRVLDILRFAEGIFELVERGANGERVKE